jgi:hypothetical protein
MIEINSCKSKKLIYCTFNATLVVVTGVAVDAVDAMLADTSDSERLRRQRVGDRIGPGEAV